MLISVIAPVGEAFSRLGKILFRPFDAVKWLKLGFCAFLASFGNCGGGSGQTGFHGNDNLSTHDFERFKEWVVDHLALILTVGTVVFLLLVSIALVLIWLQCRGRFMFLDGVVRDRGAVVEPWGEFRREGNSLFRFSVVMTLIGTILTLGGVGAGLLLAWNDIETGRFGGGALSGLLVGGGMLLVTGLGAALINLFVNDFVVPAMYARRVGVLAGWSIVSGEVLGPHLGTVVLYVLMKILIAIVSVGITFGIICGTLCLASCILMIPYIGTVVLLPLYVFDRCYSVAFLQQLGKSWILGPGADDKEAVPG